MPHIERTLREFALWMRDQAPEVNAVRDLRRAHIERYKRHVAQKPNLRGGWVSKRTIAGELSTLRICLERLAEWDGEDAPARTLMFPGDVPKLDDPLPRFIDDGAAKKLIQAARATDDPFARLTVEFLARTGLRRGEFLDLKIDSVVQIGAAYWLHVPLGKLRTDRYIPLHPQLKELLDAWVADPAGQPPRAVAVHGPRPADRTRERPQGTAEGRQRGRARAGDPASAAPHAGYAGDQPRHVARGDRRAAGT
jgi:integrase